MKKPRGVSAWVYGDTRHQSDTKARRMTRRWLKRLAHKRGRRHEQVQGG